MPRKLLMTYVSSQKRWTKKYNGKMFSVSCKQLGCPSSEAASWMAANLWWEAKQAEIDAQARQEEAAADPASHILRTALGGISVEEARRKLEEAEALRKLLSIYEAASVHGQPVQTLETGQGVTIMPDAEIGRSMAASGEIPPEVMDQVLSPMGYGLSSERRGEKMSRLAEQLQGQAAPTHRTVQHQVDAWCKMLLSSVSTKQLSPGRYDAYKRRIGLFTKWIGSETAIDAITAAKLEEWWAFLSLKVAERVYSTATAKEMLMTVRQFIRRLAAWNLIPLPGNIGDRRLCFHDGPRTVETIEVSEVRKLLDASSERLRLSLLLMLNAGMYQNDIAELAVEEIDWDRGILERYRSKTADKRLTSVAKTRYQLWPETMELLRKLRAKQDVRNDRGGRRVLLTDEGNPLVSERVEGGKFRAYDTIANAYRLVAGKIGIKKTLKMFRKTSASLLASHPQYKFYTVYFLAQSPKSVAERHYIKPSDEEFFSALEWLRKEILEGKKEGPGD